MFAAKIAKAATARPIGKLALQSALAARNDSHEREADLATLSDRRGSLAAWCDFGKIIIFPPDLGVNLERHSRWSFSASCWSVQSTTRLSARPTTSPTR
jgi:hypothetical protein